jgi:enhancer of yellow 2 transcription factor
MSLSTTDEAEFRARLYERLEASGELAKLRQLVVERLQSGGWEDELKAKCKDAIRSRGIENITLDALVEELTPMARASVPPQVKAEVMERIRHLMEGKPSKP